MKHPAITRSNDLLVPAFYKTYLDRVPADADIFDTLTSSRDFLIGYLQQLSPADWNHRYAPDKWTVKEKVLHMIDTERIFAGRILRIGRGDQTPLPGFSQDDYVPLSGANDRDGQSLIDEYRSVRTATLTLLQGMPAAAWARTGTASGHPVAMQGIAFIIAGHELHHIALLRERYFVA